MNMDNFFTSFGTQFNHANLSSKRSGSPSLSRASKRLRSVEMTSVSDSTPSLPASTPMSTSTTDIPMSISELSTMSANRPMLHASSTHYPIFPAHVAPSPFAVFGNRAATAPPTSAFDHSTGGHFPTSMVPISAVPSASFGFPVLSLPAGNRRLVDELRERAGSAPAVISAPVLSEATEAGPCASPIPVLSLSPSPAPGPTASSTPVVHDPVPVKVESISSRHGSLFSDHSSATSTALLPRSPSSSFYTDFHSTPPPAEAAVCSIQGLNKHELFEVVHPETLREWEAVSSPKVVIFIANDTITKETHHRVTLIRNALTVIFPDADPVIGSAETVSDFAHYEPVYPFLVHHIPELYARRLIMEHCWTINDFTFFVLDFSPMPTPFMMTLTGLHLPARPQSNDTVTQLVRRRLLDSASVMSFIQKYHDNLPSFMTVNEQTGFTMGTIEVLNVKLDDAEDSPVVFNVYIHPPTNDPVQHLAWQQEIRAITYFADCGTGKAVPLFHCNVCKGRDHSSISCLFPSNTSMEKSSSKPETSSTVKAGCTEYRERGVHVNGINFNYFMNA